MKKLGFTLAEVLITLGIIGVVAALTTPALVSEYNKSKVGPILKRFINTMENANQQLLYDNEGVSISSFNGNDDSSMTKYCDELAKYIKGSNDTEHSYYSNDIKHYNYDGTVRTNNSPVLGVNTFLFADGSAMELGTYDPGAHNGNGSYKGAIAELVFDINGFETKPNRLGRDQFCFTLDDGGAIIPWGGKTEYMAYNGADRTISKYKWKDGDNKCSENTVNTGENCAGSIFDNNGKVIYKY